MCLAPGVGGGFEAFVPRQHAVKQGVKARGMVGKNQMAEFVQNDKFDIFKGQAH